MSLRNLSAVCFSIVATVLSTDHVSAQSSMKADVSTANGPITYKQYDQTFYREEPVKAFKWVEEEVMETSQKSRWVPEYKTETLERKSVCYRPIVKTSERIETYKEMEPVTVTKFREKKIEETSFETTTEMQEETVLVKKPVVETQMRDKKFTVREKVTEDSFELKPVTTLKPVTIPETSLVPSNVLVNGAVRRRPRLQYLRSGNYVDPSTGLSVYRRRGLHFVNPSPVAAVVPALVPQTSSKVAFMPETTMTKEPIEISRFVDRVETRKVPVEVTSMKETYETRKVPVEVRRPKTTTRVEKIPYQETSYREVEKTRKVPVVEKTMQKVETIEPYDRTTAKWVEKVEEVKTPKTVRRKVEYTAMKKVPYTVRMRVAVDCFGNAVGKPEPVDPRMNDFFSTTNRPSDDQRESVVDADRDRRPTSFNVDPDVNEDINLSSPAPADLPPTLLGATSVAKPAMDSHSVLVPETKKEVETSTSLKTLVGPPLEAKTQLRPLSPERTLAESVGAPQAVETSTFKPATDYPMSDNSTVDEPLVDNPLVDSSMVKADFNKNLIEPPSVPNLAPRTFDVEGIDKTQELKRRSITTIY